MCLSYRNRDPKTRILMVIANLSLVAAILLWNFLRSNAALSDSWLDAVCGILFGISIGVNLLTPRWRRRCREPEAR